MFRIQCILHTWRKNQWFQPKIKFQPLIKMQLDSIFISHLFDNLSMICFYWQSKINVIIAITLSLMMISTLLKQRSDIVSLSVLLSFAHTLTVDAVNGLNYVLISIEIYNIAVNRLKTYKTCHCIMSLKKVKIKLVKPQKLDSQWEFYFIIAMHVKITE